jgi:hypothetical protein
MKVNLRGRVRLYVPLTPRHLIRDSSIRGVARRPFGLVRRDLLLQIGPSVSDPELVTS